MEKFSFGAFVNAYDLDLQWDATHQESLAQFRNFMARPEAEDVVMSLIQDYVGKFGSPLDQHSPVGFGQPHRGGYIAKSYGPPRTSQFEKCNDCGRMRQKG